MNFKRARLTGSLTAATLLLLAAPAHATEGQPPQAITVVTCASITVDPEPTFGVRFQGAIGDQDVDLLAHHVPGTHDSTADDTAYTGGTGTIHYVITPLWTIPPNPYGIGSGPGVTVEGDLECHEAPTATTSTIPETTTTSPSTSTTSPTRQQPSQPSTSTTSMQIGTPTSISAPPADALPRTGSSTVPFAVAGFGLVGLGSLALALTRKKKTA